MRENEWAIKEERKGLKWRDSERETEGKTERETEREKPVIKKSLVE